MPNPGRVNTWMTKRIKVICNNNALCGRSEEHSECVWGIIVSYQTPGNVWWVWHAKQVMLTPQAPDVTFFWGFTLLHGLAFLPILSLSFALYDAWLSDFTVCSFLDNICNIYLYVFGTFICLRYIYRWLGIFTSISMVENLSSRAFDIISAASSWSKSTTT